MRADVLLTGQMLPLIDTSITNVALDSITHSLHATATELELIVALYGVAFAVCYTAPGSKLGDNLGRRRLFMWGVACFGLASLLCGMAGNIEPQLLGARILQGAGAALIMPQSDVACDVKGTAHARTISLFRGISGIALSSARWVAAGWCRRTSPGWAGATPSLSTCRFVWWCWR